MNKIIFLLLVACLSATCCLNAQTLKPTRQWGTFYGGNGDESGVYEYASIAIDRAGNIYMTGTTTSTSGIAVIGGYQVISGGGQDAFLVKLNSAGVLQWATYFGGTGDDNGYGVAVDTSGDVYITGMTNSTSAIATPGSYQPAYAGGAWDAFLAKFTSGGTLLWATYYGAADNDRGFGVAVDTLGNAYMYGLTYSTTGIASAGAYQTTYGGSGDCFLVKFDGTGARQWATYYGGSGTEEVSANAVDLAGNVYITGNTNSTSGIATPGSYQSANAGGGDGFLVKFSGAGVPVWGTYYGGNGNDVGSAITFDGLGNVYLAGITNSSSGIATTGAYQNSAAGGNDAFLAKFTSAGVRKWATYYGGFGDDYGFGVVSNGAANVYLAGLTSSTSGIVTTGTYQPLYGGGAADNFLVKFDTAGSVHWGTYYGGLGDELGYPSLVHYGNGYFYMSGVTNSTGAIATAGSCQPTFGGGLSDAFLVKFVDSATVLSTDENVSAGAQVKVYPDPATSVMHIDAGPYQQATADIYNTLGQKVASQALQGASTEVNVCNLVAGMYVLCLTDAEDGHVCYRSTFLKQ